MKLLLSLTLLLTLFAGAARAGVTNITIKVTTEIDTVGTNSTSIKFTQNGSAKDALTVDSLVWYYGNSFGSGVYTNTWDDWLKDTAKAALQSHNAERSANVLGAAAAKIAAAATTDSSLLTFAQKQSILTIAATLP